MSRRGAVCLPALARLLGQEPEAMEGRCWTSGWPPRWRSQWPDMTAAGRELDFLVAGQRDPQRPRLPINLGAARLSLTPLAPNRARDDNRMAALENALKSLSRQAIIEDGRLLGELSRLGGEFRSLADDLIRQRDDEPLRAPWWTPCVSPWRPGSRAPARGKIVLAEKSKLWRVCMDRSSPQTRTLDKYLNLDTLPKAPRWKTVVASAEYVLKHCA